MQAILHHPERQVCQPNQKNEMQMPIFFKWYSPVDEALKEVISNYWDIVAAVQSTEMFPEWLHLINLPHDK